MNVFKDNAGREWNVSITIGSIMRVKEMLGIDLMELANGDAKLITDLQTDDILFGQVIYVICKPQADELGIKDKNFYDAMAGDDLDQAMKVFLDGLVSFFRSPKIRALVKTMVDQANKSMDLGIDIITTKVQSKKMDTLLQKGLSDMEKQMDDSIEKALSNIGESSGNSQESSASTPALTP